MKIFGLFKALEEPVEPREKKKAEEARVELLQNVMKLQRTARDIREDLARAALKKAARSQS